MRDHARRGVVPHLWKMLASGLAMGAALTSAALLTGCEGFESRRAPKTQVVAPDPQADAMALFGYRLDWRGYAFVGRRAKPLFMVGMGDSLAFQDSGGRISLLESATGRVRWSSELAGPLTLFTEPIRSGNAIHTSSESELFTLAIDTGNLVGRERFEKVITTRPVAVGQTLIYGTSIGEVMGHLTNVGVKLWGFQMNGAIQRDAVLIGSTVGAVSQAGDVVFLDASSGGLIGRSKIFGGLTTNPVSDGSLMFVASSDQSLYGINPTGGRIVWRIRTDAPLRVQPSVVDGVLYCQLPGRGLCAIDPASGTIRWENPKAAGEVLCARGQNVVAWDGKSAHLIEPGTGDILASAELKNVTILETEGLRDPVVYITDDTGRIARFIAR